VIELDEAARARLFDRFGPDVARWCDELPALLEELAKRWHLEYLAAVPGNTGRTLMCRDGTGRSVVLKVTPELDIAATEATALRAWADCSRVVRLLDSDHDAGAVLLEGVEPGTTLSESAEETPLDQVAELLTQLHTVAGAEGIPTVAERVTGFFDLTERRWRGSAAERHIPIELLRRSRAAAMELTTGGPVALLHGDLHPGNVLWDASGVIAIDPRPCVGDAAFDSVDWAVLPMSRGGSLEDGIAALAAHLPDLDTDRLRRWCEVFAVLFALGPLRREAPTPYTDALLEMARGLR
jgi:streptomycin 6-kinase